MKRIIALFLLIFTACSCFAQTPMELLEKYVPNISIPDKNIETFHFQMTINNEGDIYVVQAWYKNNGHIGFNLFDKDKTPVLVIRNDKVLLYDVLSKQTWLSKGNITILKIMLENAQLIANVVFHKPSEAEKENAAIISFLDLAKQADANMTATEKDGLLEINGHTAQNSIETIVVDTKAEYPMKSLKIDTGNFTCLIDDIKINTPMADEEPYFMYPGDTLTKAGVNLVEMNDNEIIAAMQLSNILIHGCMVRAAIYNESLREDLEKGFNTRYEWAELKASDMMNSAKLRQIFKLGE